MPFWHLVSLEGVGVYIEEPGTTDGDLQVTINGEELVVEATTDTNMDGVDDAALLETDAGHFNVTDTNGDGTADLMHTLNDRGEITGTARFDAATGTWVSDGQGSLSTMETQGGLVVETTAGREVLTGDLVDTDGDGKLDTQVIAGEDGSTQIFADTNGDGVADTLTKISSSGQIEVSEYRGAGEWVVVQSTELTPDAAPHNASWSDSVTPTTSFHIDPQTGQWVES